MTAENEEKIKHLQRAEQSMQALMSQKQALQMQLMELESALKELETANEAYKIVGNVMVLSKKDKLDSDLKSKKETVELRIKTLETQEKDTREKAETIQKEVLEAMKNDDKNDK
ncbi:prefoldin subunit beta [Candidatus Woesearchaeota archaeon]|nr:prefoldin subunit beta [Candidatus Woesearchaeota archaeon]|tara:strand:+ start:512 stop:853 length:342 start_codon:yes stop_codon:yes gene_type:complete